SRFTTFPCMADYGIFSGDELLMMLRIVACCCMLLLLAALHLPAQSDEAKPAPQVTHPNGVIKAADLARAQQNLQRYQWARDYLAHLQKNVDVWTPQITPAFLEEMIPETTP